MNKKNIVKVTNIIGLVSIGILVYNGIADFCIRVFNLSMLEDNRILDNILLYLLLLLVVIISFIVNCMLNLSIIRENTENHGVDIEVKKNNNKYIFISLVAIIPLIILSLFIRNYVSERMKENQIRLTANNLIKTFSNELTDISMYSFTEEWIEKANDLVSLVAEVDQNTDSFAIIVKDEINGSDVYLSFTGGFLEYIREARNIARNILDVDEDINDTEETNHGNGDETKLIKKEDYIFSSTVQEREYLDIVFNNNFTESKFTFDSDYSENKLFVPFVGNEGIVVLLFDTSY